MKRMSDFSRVVLVFSFSRLPDCPSVYICLNYLLLLAPPRRPNEGPYNASDELYKTFTILRLHIIKFSCRARANEPLPRTAYEIRQGTIEQDTADKEWVLAHYTRTAKKRRVL